MKKPPALARAAERGLAPLRGRRAAQLVPQAKLAGPMPWVLAIMVALTVIASAGGLALGNLVARARAELAGGATVQIVEADQRERMAQANRAVELLVADQAVTAVRLVPEQELEELLEPWLGAQGDSDAVPMPALIDVRLEGAAEEQTLDRLRRMLANAAPAARIDAQSGWLQPVFGAISSLRWLAGALVALLALTSAAAVWLAARSALGNNRQTIEVVHLLGGSDAQIARIFQRSVAMDAALGGAAGLALGLLAVFTLAQSMAGIGFGTAGAGAALEPGDWIVLAAIPLAGIAIAMLTVRLTVLASLRKTL